MALENGKGRWISLELAVLAFLGVIIACVINNWFVNRKTNADLLARPSNCNEENCPCLNMTCERHGKCCECINFHRSKKGIVFCMHDEKKQVNIR